MKKYLIIVGIVVVVLILLSYIGDISDENEKKRLFEESRKEKTTESNMGQLMNEMQYYDNHPELLIKLDEAVEDYKYIWENLEVNYPYFGVAERLYGVKYLEIKEKYLQDINNKAGLGLLPPNITWFEELIKNCLAEFKNLGYLDFASLAENNAVFIDDKIDDYNVTHKILDADTAYIKLQARANAIEQFEYDKNKVMEFYSQIQDRKNLIIDMTQYYGDNTYWEKLIVEPNIDRDISVEQYFCAKNGSLDIDFLRIVYPNFYISEIDMDLNVAPNINQDDLKMFDKLYTFHRRISSSNNYKKMFSGNIYVLIDKNTNTATEDFAAFCKNTGFAEIAGRKTEALFSLTYRNSIQISNSEMLVGYTPIYLLNKDGSCNAEFGTEPDFISKNYTRPLDTCLQIIAERNPKIIEYQEEDE